MGVLHVMHSVYYSYIVNKTMGKLTLMFQVTPTILADETRVI